MYNTNLFATEAIINRRINTITKAGYDLTEESLNKAIEDAEYAFLEIDEQLSEINRVRELLSHTMSTMTAIIENNTLGITKEHFNEEHKAIEEKFKKLLMMTQSYNGARNDYNELKNSATWLLNNKCEG